MTKSKMKEVEKLLGVEIGVPFKVKYGDGKYSKYNPYVFKYDGLYDRDGDFYDTILSNLLIGKYEIEQPILDEIEKRYLEGVFRPFKDIILYITKKGSIVSDEYECIMYTYKLPNGNGSASSTFPYFKNGTMYKDMELNKEYTLEELGLFQD